MTDIPKQKSVNASGNSDNQLLSKFKIPMNENLDDYAMAPIRPKSLIIKNGVMYILGGVSSGKSTLLSKLIAVYNKEINPIIMSFYSGMTPDETTTFALSSFNVKPYFIRLQTPEAMMSFFNQFRYKRLKLAELLMFLQSVYKNNVPLLMASIELIQELELTKHVSLTKFMTPLAPQGGVLNASAEVNEQKRLKILLAYIDELITTQKINVKASPKNFIYASEFLMKTYARRRGVSFDSMPDLFIAHALISFAKGFHETTITIDVLNDPTVKASKNKKVILNRFIPYTFKPFIRLSRSTPEFAKKPKLELVPSISIFDDVASFPLLTAERSNQWTKDLFAETRRWQNTFIIAAQRHNLLNKTLRSLTHSFFIGYSLVDDDIPRIAKEIPSNLLSSKDFMLFYSNVIKPFTFFVYNNKFGYNVLTLSR